MNTNHLAYWLAALHLPGIGPRRFLRWLSHFADIQALFAASETEWRSINLSDREIAALLSPNWAAVEKELVWLKDSNHAIVCFSDAAYPLLLKEIPDPPLVLYVKGNLAALSSAQLAIVGSRHATISGLQHARKFASSLAEAGLVITSGLALGIDSASHQGALAVKGTTLAVCGTGLQHIYPRRNKTLSEEIISQGGALISEFPLATGPLATHFPRRNRIISGLSLGVFVVEAALKSGSLITAQHALEQGREVFALPGPIHQALSRGCHHLIRQGATLVEKAEDIIDELSLCSSWRPKLALPAIAAANTMLDAAHRLVLEQISHEMTILDVIHCRSGLTASELSSILLTLELRGYIQSVSGGYVRIV